MTYALAKNKDELTLDEKLEMVNQVSGYDGRFDDLRYEENAEDFFDTFYGSRPYELARAISYGEYNFTDPFVKINDYGNIESAYGLEIEEMIDDQFDELSEAFVELLNEGNIEDYYNLCAEVSALRREKLTPEELNESYYEKSNDSYTLEFLVDGHTIFVSNIPGADHAEARENEHYWNDPENVYETLYSAEDKDITDKNGVSIDDENFCKESENFIEASEQKSVGIRATIETNKEKAATKEPVKPSKEHAIGEDR